MVIRSSFTPKPGDRSASRFRLSVRRSRHPIPAESVEKRLCFSWQLLQFQMQRSRSRSAATNAGFSLLEVLVAIVIVALILVSITPPIFMATAARVQQRRAELAQQLAQSEIDRVRTTVERGVYSAADLPDVRTSLSGAPPTVVLGQLKSTKSSCSTYTGATVSSTTLLPVDVNGDCQSDFLLQSFRTQGPAGTAVPTSGFRMVVRVYADTPLLRQQLANLNTTPASLKFTTGLGQQVTNPLSVLYSTIVRNDTNNSLQDYRTVCSTAGSC